MTNTITRRTMTGLPAKWQIKDLYGNRNKQRIVEYHNLTVAEAIEKMDIEIRKGNKLTWRVNMERK